MSKKVNNTVTLRTPLKVGDKEIKTIDVREPKAGELRGIKLINVMQMDVAAYEKLLPRITDPALTVEQVGDLALPDMLAFMDIVGNLSNPAE